MKNLLCTIMLVSIFFGCSNEKNEKLKPIIIAGKIENYTKGEVKLNNWDVIHVVNPDASGNFKFTLDYNHPVYMHLMHAKLFLPTYSQPGDSLYITFDVSSKDVKKSVQCKADRQTELIYLLDRDEFYKQEIKGFYNSNNLTIPYDSILLVVEENYRKIYDKLEAIKKMVSPDFIAFENWFINYKTIEQKTSYAGFKKAFHDPANQEMFDPDGKIDAAQVDTIPPVDFFIIDAKNLDINNGKLSRMNPGVYNKGLNKALWYLDPKLPTLKVTSGFEEKLDYYEQADKKLRNYVTDTLIIEGYYYSRLKALVRFSELKMAETFLPMLTEGKRKDEVIFAIQEKKDLMSGTFAFPDFVTETIEGEEITKNDLLGKYTYIDFWATWCAPCRKEIPFLKKLEKEYHGKNIQFMSISVDSPSAKDLWKNMVIDMELTGIQVHIDPENYAPIKEKLKILGIPRFALVDKQGVCIAFDAPRPSSDEVRPLLDGLKGL